MSQEFEKIVILSAGLAPAAIGLVFFAHQWLDVSEIRGRRLQGLYPLAGAGLGIILWILFWGPPLDVSHRTIDLTQLAEEMLIVGITTVASLILAVISYLALRRLNTGLLAIGLACCLFLVAYFLLVIVASSLENGLVIGAAMLASLTLAASLRLTFLHVRDMGLIVISVAGPPAVAALLLLIQFYSVDDPNPRGLVVRQAHGFSGEHQASVVQISPRLNFVTSLDSDSKGRIIFTEFRTGKIDMLEPQPNGSFKKRGLTTVPLPKTMTDNQGLWQAELNTAETYLYATAIEQTIPAITRLIRFPYQDGQTGPMEVVISEIPAIPDHYGGAITFDSDGNVLFSVGIGNSLIEKGDLGAGAGIFRLNQAGGIPADNPFPPTPVYAYGFRNPYGIAMHPLFNELYVVDNGSSCCDRLYRVESGSFHGWPKYGRVNPGDPDEILAMEADSSVTAPLWDSGVSKVVPTQLLAYTGERYGSEFKGNLLFGSYGQGGIRRIALSKDGTKVLSYETALEFATYEPIIGITQTEDGYIYFATTTRIFRVESFGG